MDRSKIGVLVVGALTAVIGGVMTLGPLGVLPAGTPDPTIPLWQQRAVALIIGLVFAAGGAAAALTAFPGRVSRIANRALGLAVAIGLTALFAWVAAGSGSRAFSSPLAIFGPRVNAISGRIVFGLGALLGLTITVLMIRHGGASSDQGADQSPDQGADPPGD